MLWDEFPFIFLFATYLYKSSSRAVWDPNKSNLASKENALGQHTYTSVLFEDTFYALFLHKPLTSSWPLQTNSIFGLSPGAVAKSNWPIHALLEFFSGT